MNRQQVLLFVFAGIALVSLPMLGSGSEAFLASREDLPSSAVDAKGVRHTTPAHSARISPWMQDGIKLVAPSYPIEDRRLNHTGIGLFRVYLDLSTGAVKQVSVLKSTGFATLDDSAITAFRLSRLKPGKWKEIDVPVKFIMARSQYWSPPPGAVPLAPH